MKHELRVMLGQKRGSIVNISSAYGSVGAAYASVYVASKHAVEGMTKAAALEVARTGVRINAVAPGPVETGMLNRFTGTTEREDRIDRARAADAHGTSGGDRRQAIVFIGSETTARRSSRGRSLGVDGGMLA